MSQEFSPQEGLLELSLLNAESSTADFDEVVVDGITRGIPPELLTRLKELWEKTKVVAGEIIAVGKIIVRQIFDFLKENPKLSLGLAFGAAVAALISGIPLLGPLVAPLATTLAMLYGAGAGAAMDAGDTSGSLYSAAIALATKCFELLKNIFNAIVQYWV
jgi:hypothetical protein